MRIAHRFVTLAITLAGSMPMALAVLAVTALSGLMPTAFAGPNAGGTLLVHTRPDIAYCSGSAFCGVNDYSNGCASLLTRLPSTPSETHVWWITAAFPASATPRVKAVTFGVDYDPASLLLVDWGKCGGLEIPNPDWPGPGSGTAVTWAETQHAHLVDVYWFAGYTYADADVGFRLQDHPTQGGGFADDEVPSVIDPIADYGQLGFGRALGYLPCPEELGACCMNDGTCVQATRANCAGDWLGSSVACEIDPCALGACCLSDGACRFESEEACATEGGIFEGARTGCEPNPCSTPTGACCLASGACEVLTEASCTAGGGTFIWNDVACDPAPCGRPHYTLAPDGGGDLPTIQAAINASSNGAVIELADGVYRGAGNREVDYLGKAVTVRSASGDRAACVLDCEELARGFVFRRGEGPNSVLERISVVHGRGSDGGAAFLQGSSPTLTGCVFSDCGARIGGALFINGGAATIDHCIFAGNHGDAGAGAIGAVFTVGLTLRDSEFRENLATEPAGEAGAVIVVDSYELKVERCTFWGNVATLRGGALELGGNFLEADVDRCTFAGNSAGAGSAISSTSGNGLDITVTQCIMAFNQGSAFNCTTPSLKLRCCDVFGNVGGNYTECTQTQSGIRGNISLDPLFCDLASGRLELRPGSPARPKPWANVSSCGLMGSEDDACSGPRSMSAQREPGIGETSLGAIHPNPTSGSITFSLSLRERAEVRLELIDVAGRVVRRFVDGPLDAGAHDFEESLTGGSRPALAAGVYYLSVHDGHARMIRKLVLLQ